MSFHDKMQNSMAVDNLIVYCNFLGSYQGLNFPELTNFWLLCRNTSHIFSNYGIDLVTVINSGLQQIGWHNRVQVSGIMPPTFPSVKSDL